MMYRYFVYYDGALLYDSNEDGNLCDDDEEAFVEASDYIDSKIDDWEVDEVDYDRDLFSVEVEEVVSFDKKRVQDLLFNAIIALFDLSGDYNRLDDEEFIQRVCNHIGMTRTEYDIVMEL